MKARRFDLSPDEWIAGCQGLTEEEEGIYIRLTVRIYSRGKRLRVEGLAAYCGCDPRRFQRVVDSLIAKGKVQRLTGDREDFGEKSGEDRGEVFEMLSIHRCEVEVTSAIDRMEVAANLARIRWKTNQ